LAERTLGDEIDVQIMSRINEIPMPEHCKVTKNYPDNRYVDVETDTGQTLKSIQLIGDNTVGQDGLLVYLNGTTKPIIITSNSFVYQKLGLNKAVASKFNFAMINKTEGTVNYEEFWILANAYYDYDIQRFVKINPESNSFGIQIQAEGSYPGESELGYTDNTSIGIWRNTKHSYVTKDTTNYDYTDFDTKNHIGAKRLSDGKWIDFAISAGWNNNFMMDAFGGMTIGGAGLELDGNGIFPYTRLTSSAYSDGIDNYYLLGILDNAYHPTLWGWQCDNNATWSWFVGLKIPEAGYLTKDNENASFVVMYNDTDYNASNIHELDVSRWHIVFEVNKNGIVG